MRKIHFYRDLTVLVGCLFCTCAALAQSDTTAQTQIQVTGASGLWVLANVSYAGMRAQNNPSVNWRILSFIVGFPGTIVSFFAVTEGSDRAYGIDLPRKGRP